MIINEYVNLLYILIIAEALIMPRTIESTYAVSSHHHMRELHLFTLGGQYSTDALPLSINSAGSSIWERDVCIRQTPKSDSYSRQGNHDARRISCPVGQFHGSNHNGR